MVYTSDYYTTRSYSTRPVVTSYSVSYPAYRYPSALTRVYSTSYPIYSYHSSPYINRYLSTPSVRVISSPIRTYTNIATSPYRVSVSPIRVISSVPSLRYYRTSVSPVRVISSPIRDYRLSVSPERVITSPIRTTYTYRTPSAVLAREYDRIAYKPRPRIGYYPLENYLNSESFINFDTETRKIRSTAEILLREIHSPVHRRYRSTTPFVTYREPPMSSYALDSYIARSMNPLRNIANDVRAMSCIPESSKRYSGKSHLASIKILGDKVYSIRNPMYSADKVRSDINLLSYYSKNRRAASEKMSKEGVEISSVEAVAVTE